MHAADAAEIGMSTAHTINKVGIKAFHGTKQFKANAGAGAAWVFQGLILAAKTGMDYRRLKAGEITSAQFNRNVRQNTAAGIGSVLGGAAGIALGVPVGYYAYEKIGSVVGAVIFGIIGSEIGEYVFESVEEQLENMLIGHRES